MYLLHTQLCAWACYKTPCPHRHNVRSALVLEGIRDSAMITNGSSTVGTKSMVELPIHVGSSKDSSEGGSNRIMEYSPRRNLQVSSNIRCCRAFQLSKSANLYLPDMTQLWGANSERCSMLYDELTDTGCDMVIEQTLMRTLKSVEQLTSCSKRSQKANTLAFMLVVKVSGEQTIESALLYQRLIVVSQSGDISAD